MEPTNQNDGGLGPETARHISREELSELPIRRYEGRIQVVDPHSDLGPVIEDISRTDVVGFDTETRPAFRRGVTHLPSLVQFATAGAVYLFRVQRGDFSGAIGEILSSGTIIKTGVSVTDDLLGLRMLFEFEERSVVDLGHVARHHGMKQTGVRNLAGIFLGSRIPKGSRTTNWAAPRLTPQQIVYAATDAWACRELYLRFRQLDLV